MSEVMDRGHVLDLGHDLGPGHDQDQDQDQDQASTQPGQDQDQVRGQAGRGPGPRLRLWLSLGPVLVDRELIVRYRLVYDSSINIGPIGVYARLPLVDCLDVY